MKAFHFKRTLQDLVVTMSKTSIFALLSSLILFSGCATTPTSGWVATNQTGCKAWSDSMDASDVVMWDGGCLNGKLSGNGELIQYESGFSGLALRENGLGSYRGDMVNGKRQGKGETGKQYRHPVHPDAMGTYSGYWIDGKRNGYGELKYKSLGKIYRGIWVEDKLTLPCTTDNQCTDMRLSSAKEFAKQCISAMVPNPNPHPDESTLFYGSCANGKALTGIVFWQNKGVPVGIDCLSKGAFLPSNRTDAFDACIDAWEVVPDYCQKGHYKGQCKNGEPNGLGFESTNSSNAMFGGGSMSIRKGQFENGAQNGYGLHYSIVGCGMAGCSGNPVKEVGWFENGNKTIDCEPYTNCLAKVSGKAFVTAKGSKTEIDTSKLAALRSQNTFESMLAAFNLSGDRVDLKDAAKLAQTKQQKAQLEFTFMRVAGYSKVITLKAIVTNGNKSINVDDSNHLLGFFHAVNSTIPVKINWELGSNKDILPLQDGKYSVVIKVGVNINTSQRACIGIFCNNVSDTDEYWKKYNVVLSKKGSYKASGIYDLSVNGSSKGEIFVGETTKTITGIVPVISIESVTLLP